MNVDTSLDDELYLSIAGVSTRLCFFGIPKDMMEQISLRYSTFVDQNKLATSTITIRIQNGDLYLPLSNEGWQVKTTIYQNKFLFNSYYEQGWFDFTTDRGELIMRPQGFPENFLRVLFAHKFLEKNSLILHACGIIHNSEGYIFLGDSGSGKTTIAKLSQRDIILSDDLVILQYEETENPTLRVLGAPFYGEYIEIPRVKGSFSIRGLYKIVKDQEHKIKSMNRAEAVSQLASCVPFIMSSPENSQRVLEMCFKITQIMPMKYLYFSRDPGFWNLIDE